MASGRPRLGWHRRISERDLVVSTTASSEDFACEPRPPPFGQQRQYKPPRKGASTFPHCCRCRVAAVPPRFEEVGRLATRSRLMGSDHYYSWMTLVLFRTCAEPRPWISTSSQEPAVWQDSHSLSNSKGVVLRSEDSAISSVANKSFRIPIAHPILSLRSFSRTSGGWLDRGG